MLTRIQFQTDITPDCIEIIYDAPNDNDLITIASLMAERLFPSFANVTTTLLDYTSLN